MHNRNFLYITPIHGSLSLLFSVSFLVVIHGSLSPLFSVSFLVVIASRKTDQSVCKIFHSMPSSILFSIDNVHSQKLALALTFCSAQWLSCALVTYILSQDLGASPLPTFIWLSILHFPEFRGLLLHVLFFCLKQTMTITLRSTF